jgi:hypothetical protein
MIATKHVHIGHLVGHRERMRDALRSMRDEFVE